MYFYSVLEALVLTACQCQVLRPFRLNGIHFPLSLLKSKLGPVSSQIYLILSKSPEQIHAN